MDSHMSTELVVDALEIAVWRHKPSIGLVHHYDHDAQYTAMSFGKRLEEVSIVPSMGRTGTTLDNAMAQSFIATLKTELVHCRRFPDREVARSAIIRVPGRVLQPAQAALGAELLESCRLRGGYDGRSGRGVDATRPRDRGHSSVLCVLVLLVGIWSLTDRRDG